MKTYTSRWVENPHFYAWELRERDGGKVLAEISQGGVYFFWRTMRECSGWCRSKADAQRQVRKALDERARKRGE